MKKKLLYATVAFILFSCKNSPTNIDLSNIPDSVNFEMISWQDEPVIKKGDPGTENNKYGFEGGNVVKVNGEYHWVTTEMAGDPEGGKTKLAHWKSKDGLKWERIGSLYESSGEFEGKDPCAALWGPMFVYDDSAAVWTLVYVGYRAKPNTDTAWYLNYEGKIYISKSTVPGIEGINGPYKDDKLILRPDENDDDWEGLQGTDSFFPYKVGNKWYGFYGSAQSGKIPCKFWGNGLAEAPSLYGPWKKNKDLSPVDFKAVFSENPIVYKLDNGLYIAIMDFGDDQKGEFGYTCSKDGIHWSKGYTVCLTPKMKKWWTALRTPTGLIKEDDGTFTAFFTANTDKHFAEVGMVKLKLVQ